MLGAAFQAFVVIAAVGLATDGETASIINEIKKAFEQDKGDLIVNVNTATPAELETIPCIGEALAREIIKKRPYEKVEDLKEVKGIGDYTYNCMAPYVKVEGKTKRR